MKRAALGALALLGVVALCGCGPVRYLGQAALGQLNLLRVARPIPEVLADPATPPLVRTRLLRVQDVRAYAVSDLGLPDTRAFRSYADLGRPFLVWNVFDAPPFSVTLNTSCFPVVGCVPYRGYFSQAAAEQEAARLRGRGDDVSVGGVSAYSTLGRLPDPVPSTLLAQGEDELIRTIIHELAHAVIYVPGDADFNESFAVAVETAGSARYRAARGLPPEDRSAAQQRSTQVNALLLSARDRLATVYAATQPDAWKEGRKRQVLDAVRAEYAALKASWNGYAGYDPWFEDTPNGLNNALLGSVAAYADHVPAFLALLQRLGGDFPAFYAQVKHCGARPAAERVPCLGLDSPNE
ncbi:aminopeptidase [Deinococcus sonorensis]|uniref:Aminopeptidase n=2 Tax=Deinococcus sonorensis TaxID=309891 RepID=A0AAU7U7K5_9DEIO